MDFWRASQILRNRKWFIVLSIAVTTGLTWGATRIIGSRWQATVRFVVPQNSPLANSSGKSDSQPIPEAGPLATETAKSQATIYTAIVKSRDVIEPVLRGMSRVQRPKKFFENIEIVSVSPRLFELHLHADRARPAQHAAHGLVDKFV